MITAKKLGLVRGDIVQTAERWGAIIISDAHDELVAALETIRVWVTEEAVDYEILLKTIDAALAKAAGK